MNTRSSSTADSTSASLIERARSRDSEAWQRLARLYTPLVYSWTRQAGLDPNESADIVQDVFRSIISNLDQFRNDGPDSSFRGWLWTITRNQVRLYFRRLSARAEVSGGSANFERIQQMPDTLDQSDEAFVANGTRSLIHRALRLVRGDFEDKTWQAFWRLTVDGHSAAEIGAELGMTPKSVRQAKYRVLSRLRQELADE